MSVFDVLQERGFIAQVSHEEEIRELLEKEKITFYIGFDPVSYTHLNSRLSRNGSVMSTISVL